MYTRREAAEQLGDLAAGYGDRLWRHQFGVTDTAQLSAAVAKAFADLGRIDLAFRTRPRA